MKLTLRVARLLTVCAVIRDFFMVAPAIKNNNIRTLERQRYDQCTNVIIWGFSLYLSLASKKALAKGLCFIFRAVICGGHDSCQHFNQDSWKVSVKRFHAGRMLICTADLFILVSSDRDELCFGERLAADHLLDASNLHNVYPRLVFVQRIQHDLKTQITVTICHFNKQQDCFIPPSQFTISQIKWR